jgi:hypothetical protein
VQTLTSPDQIKCTRVGFQTRPKLENPNHEQPDCLHTNGNKAISTVGYL